MRKTILITGATDGLGLGVARVLAQQGHHLIVHGRNPEKLADVQRMLAAKATGAISTLLADLMALRQVDQLADEVLSRHSRLDVLVNNAGMGAGFANRQRVLSADGIEARFAVNYLAGYHLTRRLLPLLRASAPARIIHVSSLGQHPLDFENLQLERDFEGQRAYAQSKLAQIMFTFDLAAELAGTGVTVNALHPASLMPTNMVREGYTRIIDSLETGIDATIALIVDEALATTTGCFFDKRIIAQPNPQALDPAIRARLRLVSDELIAASLGKRAG